MSNSYEEAINEWRLTGKYPSSEDPILIQQLHWKNKIKISSDLEYFFDPEDSIGAALCIISAINANICDLIVNINGAQTSLISQDFDVTLGALFFLPQGTAIKYEGGNIGNRWNNIDRLRKWFCVSRDKFSYCDIEIYWARIMFLFFGSQINYKDQRRFSFQFNHLERNTPFQNERRELRVDPSCKKRLTYDDDEMDIEDNFN